MEVINFNRPHMTGRELYYIAEAKFNLRLAGDGSFTKRCHQHLEKLIGCKKALLTHSCTAALEMAALLLDVKPGDEIIMPSFTFVSTANAFVLRDGVPVFVDIREDTLNLDERLIEAAVTPRTRAIVPVHYAGVGCDMDAILDLAARRGLRVVEDAAQGIMSSYKGRPLGSMGAIGALSFHETKNIISGEGGALLINDEKCLQRAEIIREKGTNRSRFFRGEVDKYTWCDIGSSFLPGEITAAFLCAQLEEADSIIKDRLGAWKMYHQALEGMEKQGRLRRPVIPADCRHNAHMYYVLLPSGADRNAVLAALAADGIHAVFHYVPLHNSPMGLKCSRVSGSLPVTDSTAERLIRLPLWSGLTEEQVGRVVDSLARAIR
jgi:dTDP-4-amino-4,6-dideoxygalactose transaminase